jgi:hypothetical protein
MTGGASKEFGRKFTSVVTDQHGAPDGALVTKGHEALMPSQEAAPCPEKGVRRTLTDMQLGMYNSFSF